ncbi:MAG: VTT domain-containing protein [Myxococcota bacterium]
MDASAQFLVEYGYVVLALWVALDQTGVPVPAVPGLLAAGALAGTGQLELGAVLAVATLAGLPGNLLWYEIGRRRGGRVLRFLCRLSLEPESCVRRTQGVFARHGARALLVGKFVPGLQTAAPPLAGLLQMPRARFHAFNAAGAFLWATAFVVPGYAFHDQLERLMALGASLGGWLGAVLVALLVLYLAYKLVQRQLFLRSVRGARISPEELKRRRDAGEDLAIVDLRHRLDFEAFPTRLPGATWIPLEEIDERIDEIPRDRDVVLYCH